MRAPVNTANTVSPKNGSSEQSSQQEEMRRVRNIYEQLMTRLRIKHAGAPGNIWVDALNAFTGMIANALAQSTKDPLLAQMAAFDATLQLAQKLQMVVVSLNAEHERSKSAADKHS